MNELIQQIMSRKPDSLELKTTIKTLPRPKFLTPNNVSICVDENELFYTFNGRALYFSKDQKEPIISLPEETRTVIFKRNGNQFYCFLLNSKNKLEASEYSDSLVGGKTTITRNVLQVQKTENRVFFIFKKDVNYYIDECVFDGKKWMGKIVNHNITGNEVILFATGGTFYYTTDKQVFDNQGQYLGFEADYIYQYEGILLIGNKNEEGFTFTFKNLSDNNKDVYKTTVNVKEQVKIVSHNDILILQESTNFHILKINSESMEFSLIKKIEYPQQIFTFDFTCKDQNIIIYTLSENKLGDKTYILSSDQEITELITETEIKESLSEEEPKENIENDSSKDENIEIKPSTIESTEGFFYDNTSKKSSILREMEELSLTPPTTAQAAISTPKNNLLEEVRATLNKKKQADIKESIEEEQKKPIDRFEKYSLMSKDEENFEPFQSPVKDEKTAKNKLFDVPTTFFDKIVKSSEILLQTKSTENLLVKSSPKKNEKILPMSAKLPTTDKLSKVEIPLEPLRNPFVFKPTTKECEIEKQSTCQCNKSMKALENKMNEFIQNSIDFHSRIIKAIETLNSKKDTNENLIKEIIMKKLVPTVEACFNEMRIQMMIELKKTVSSVAANSVEEKILRIAKLLSSGKINLAIQEFIKFDEHEMHSSHMAFNSAALENADSQSLLALISKIYELVKKAPKDSYFKLICSCLMELEISELNGNQLQELCVILRSIREINEFDEENYYELSCLISIILKKIKKKTKSNIK